MLYESRLWQPARKIRRMRNVPARLREITREFPHLRRGHGIHHIELRFDKNIALKKKNAIAGGLTVTANVLGLHPRLAVERVRAIGAGSIGKAGSADR